MQRTGPRIPTRRSEIQASLLLVVLATVSQSLMPEVATAQVFALNRVADTSTPIPGGTGTFGSFSGPSLSETDVTFCGTDASGKGGIYAQRDGGLQVVADTSTPVPGGTGTFSSFYNPYSDLSLSGSDVAFYGQESLFKGGIYAMHGGELRVVADTSTPVPGGRGTFGDFVGLHAFGGPHLSGTDVAFWSSVSDREFPLNQRLSVHVERGGGLRVVADTSNSIPGGRGTFRSIGSPLLSRTDVVFWGTDASGESGIYAERDGGLRVVADTSTPIPGGTGTFERVSSPSLSGTNVAFNGLGPTGDGIYADLGAGVCKVIAVGDRLDGRFVSGLTFVRGGLSGNRLAFVASFTPDSSGVYLAEVMP